jgi:hypothetical protein
MKMLLYLLLCFQSCSNQANEHLIQRSDQIGDHKKRGKRGKRGTAVSHRGSKFPPPPPSRACDLGINVTVLRSDFPLGKLLCSLSTSLCWSLSTIHTGIAFTAKFAEIRFAHVHHKFAQIFEYSLTNMIHAVINQWNKQPGNSYQG